MSVTCLRPPEAGEAPTTRVPAVRLRTLEPGDGAALREIFEGLGPRSRVLRFLAPKTRLTSADLRQLTSVDGRDHVALLAEATADGRPIGVARFVRDRDEPHAADVAVTVVDAWQNRGVGTLLSRALAELGLRLGVRRFTLDMLLENEGAARLLHRMEGDVERLAMDRGVAELAITLTGSPR